MSRALVIVDSAEQRTKAARWVQIAQHGTRIEFKKPRRSLPQNDKMWAMLTEVAQQVVWYGEKLTPEDWKDVFTASLRRARVVPGIDPGSFVPLGMRTSDMSIGEMADLITLMEAFGAQHDVVFADRRSAA